MNRLELPTPSAAQYKKGNDQRRTTNNIIVCHGCSF
jgi:hypothetical protein